MSDSPIFDKINKPTFEAETPEPKPKTWWEKFLTPTFRRWAYGVTAAGITVAFTFAGKPEFIPLVAPLIMAIYYVTNDGEPR